MKVKAISCLAFLLSVTLSLGACRSEEKKPQDTNNNASTGKGAGTEQDAPFEELDLTGRWMRSDGVEFKCIDSGELLTLKRILTEEEAYLVSYEVDLTRNGKTLEGTARFFYKDDPEEVTTKWKLVAVGDYQYQGDFEAYEEVDGEEKRTTIQYDFKIEPLNPKPKPEPKPEAPSTAPDGGAPKAAPADPKVVAEQLALVMGDDAAAAGNASVALARLGPEINRQLEDAAFEQTDPAKRMRVALVMAFRKQAAGLQTLQEIQQDSSLDMGTSLLVDNSIRMAVCSYMDVPGADTSPANMDAVLRDPQGDEAVELASSAAKFKPELSAVDWLKDDDLEKRKVAQYLLFPGGIALNGTYGEYSGPVYSAEDEKAQRDGAAEEFIKWFDANARAKLEK